MSVEALPKSLIPVGPHDCALAIGLPLNEKEFLRDFDRPDLFDYANNIRHLNGVSPSGAWALYQATANYARRVCDEVESDGATVVRSATLADMTNLLQKHSVVTLVSHSKWSPLQADQIRHSTSLLQAINNGKNPVAQALQKIIKQNIADEPFYPARLACVLAQITEEAHAWADRAVAAPVSFAGDYADQLPPHHLTRIALEQAFPKQIVPVRVFELRDGLHTVPDLIAAIPEAFSGILDLTICNSSMLASAIKSARPYCLVAVNQALASIDVRLARYRVVIRNLRRRPRPFGQMLEDVHSIFLERSQSR